MKYTFNFDGIFTHYSLVVLVILGKLPISNVF